MGANATTSVPTYVANEVLTAADLNITNSGIPVFATTVTRDAAFGGTGEKTLAEGQFAYIEATNTTQYYDGATWQDLGLTGQIAIFNETQAQNTAGGASVGTTWTKRVLNTTVVNTIGATLTSSVIALTAGTYKVFAISPYLGANSVNTRFRNTTDSTTPILGINNYLASAQIVGGYSQLDGTFTITGTKNFELQYYVQTARASNGLGVELNATGISEVYSQVTIQRIA